MFFYRKFKTVNEMIYVINKAYAENTRWTDEQQQSFEQEFAANLMQMLQNKKFQKEYALYEEAVAQGKVIMSPQSARQARLNKILKEIENIKLACEPYQLNKKEIWRKQADTRLKYEKRLRNKELYAKILAHKKNEK